MTAAFSLCLVIQSYRGRVDLWDVLTETVEFINATTAPAPTNAEHAVTEAIRESLETATFLCNPATKKELGFKSLAEAALINPTLLQLNREEAILFAQATKSDLREHKKFMIARARAQFEKYRKELVNANGR